MSASTANAQDTTASTTEPQATDTASDTSLGDIVVTARKISESIDTVPLAITAMTSAKIEERNLKSIEDVSSFSPGFYTQSATGTGVGRNDRSFRQLTFRGLGASTTNVAVFAGGVGFLDGTPVLNSSLANVQDVERVEVLRGPQGVYFGRSTYIGAVNYVTKNPTDYWTGRVTAEVAEDGLVDVSGAVSGPLDDWASFRLSGRHFAKNGQYFTANEGRRLGDQQTDTISLTLLLKPTEGLTIRPFFNYFEDTDGPSAQYTIGGKNFTPTAANPNPPVLLGGSNCNLGGTLGGYVCGTAPQKLNPALLTAYYTVTPEILNGTIKNPPFPVPFDYSDYLDGYGLKRKAFQLSNKIDYEFGGGDGPTLTAVTAYHQERIATLTDFVFRAGPSLINTAPAGSTPSQITLVSSAVSYKDYDWSQELRLVSNQKQALRWIIGGNYVKLKQSTSGIISKFGTFPISNGAAAAIGYTQAEAPAVFAGAYYDIVPALTISLEGRYQQDKIRGHFANRLPPLSFADVSRKFNSFSPRVSVDYKLTPTSTIYALFSRGYKPGGFNNILITEPAFIINQIAVTGALPAYDQEKLDNYEAGIKGSFLDGRVRFALDGYIGRNTNAQVPIPVVYFNTANPDGTPNTKGTVNSSAPIRNVGNIDLKGIEFEGEALVFPGFRLGGTFAYTDTKIKKYFCIECSQIVAQNSTNNIATVGALGNKVPGAPKISYTVSANYETEIDGGLTAYVGADYIYRGKYYAEAANIANSGAAETVNARLGFRKNGYSLEFFARNLFDDQSPTITYSPSDFFTAPQTFSFSGNTLRIGLPDRRRLGIRATASF